MNSTATHVTSAGVVLIATVVMSGAAAAASPPARAQILQSLSDCRKLADASERLACYDKAAAGLEAAEASGDVVVVDRDQMRSVRRQAFGFSLPSLSLFEAGAKDEDLDTLTLKIESARQQGDGKWVFRLEGGQVWRQIDTGELMRDPRPGGTATIRRAALGSYKLSLGGASTIRVHRDN